MEELALLHRNYERLRTRLLSKLDLLPQALQDLKEELYDLDQVMHAQCNAMGLAW